MRSRLIGNANGLNGQAISWARRGRQGNVGSGVRDAFWRNAAKN
jgi:hypothetical protein